MKSTKEVAVVTLAIGEFYEKMGSYTQPLMKAYASRINADFIVLSERKIADSSSLPPKYEKFQLYQLLEIYERIIFIDNDIVVLPTAPNLLDIVDKESFAAVSEESFSGSKLEKKVTQEIMGSVDWKYCYFNSGLMVIPKSAKHLFNPHSTELENWAVGEFRKRYPTVLNDQPYLNHKANKTKVKFQELDYRFNHTRAMPGSNNRFTSYLIHYAGPSGHRYGKRLEQIKMDCQVATSPLLLMLSIKVPLYRYIADRLNLSFFSYLFSRARA